MDLPPLNAILPADRLHIDWEITVQETRMWNDFLGILRDGGFASLAFFFAADGGFLGAVMWIPVMTVFLFSSLGSFGKMTKRFADIRKMRRALRGLDQAHSAITLAVMSWNTQRAQLEEDKQAAGAGPSSADAEDFRRREILLLKAKDLIEARIEQYRNGSPAVARAALKGRDPP